MHRSVFALLAAVALFAGCAMPGPLVMPPADPNGGVIVFYRPNTGFGYGQRGDILLDGRVVGRSSPGVQFAVAAAPGLRVVSVPNFLYAGERTADVRVAVGETVYVRTSIGAASFGGRFDIDVVPPAAAVAEIRRNAAPR